MDGFRDDVRERLARKLRGWANEQDRMAGDDWANHTVADQAHEEAAILRLLADQADPNQGHRAGPGDHPLVGRRDPADTGAAEAADLDRERSHGGDGQYADHVVRVHWGWHLSEEETHG